MKRPFKSSLALMAAAAICLSAVSCNRADQNKTQVTSKTAEMSPLQQKEKNEQIRRGVEESKKITIAKVNGQEITMHSLIREMNSIAPRYVREGDPIPKETTEKIRKEALDRIILKELLVQEAKRQGLSVSPDEVERVIQNVRKRQGTDEAYRQFLDSKGISEDELRTAIEKSRLFELITAKQVYEKVKIDDSAARQEYEKNRSRYMTPDDPPKQLSFEEARQKIEWNIRAEKGNEILAKWDRALRKQSKIEITLADFDRHMKEQQGRN